jgi:hypothetical protein
MSLLQLQQFQQQLTDPQHRPLQAHSHRLPNQQLLAQLQQLLHPQQLNLQQVHRF